MYADLFVFTLLLSMAAVMILIALEIMYLLAGDTQEFLGFQATAAALTYYTKPTIKATGKCIRAGSYV